MDSTERHYIINLIKEYKEDLLSTTTAPQREWMEAEIRRLERALEEEELGNIVVPDGVYITDSILREILIEDALESLKSKLAGNTLTYEERESALKTYDHLLSLWDAITEEAE